MAQVSADPPQGSTDNEDVYIPPSLGVPGNYSPKPLDFLFNPFKPPTQEQLQQYIAPTLYRQGDESRPASWGEERIIDLQGQMVDAGILKPSKYQRGVWDSASREAYQELLALANGAGVDVNTALSNYRQMAAKYGKPTESERPNQPFLDRRRDPESLRALLGAVSGRIMGGALSREEEDQFISTFNSMSEAAQRAEYVATGSGSATDPGPGGVITDVDPEAQASKFLRETRPQDVVRHDVVERFNEFQSLLSKYS